MSGDPLARCPRGSPLYLRLLCRSQPASADRVVGTILKAANGLAQFPLIGRQGVVPGARERIVTRYPYRVVDDVVEVLRIIHTARQWP